MLSYITYFLFLHVTFLSIIFLQHVQTLFLILCKFSQYFLIFCDAGGVLAPGVQGEGVGGAGVGEGEVEGLALADQCLAEVQALGRPGWGQHHPCSFPIYF